MNPRHRNLAHDEKHDLWPLVCWKGVRKWAWKGRKRVSIRWRGRILIVICRRITPTCAHRYSYHRQKWDKLIGSHAETQTAHRLTDGPDDSLLQLPLFVSFDDLGANVGAAVIRASELIVDAQTELPQQGVEHLQHSRTWIQIITKPISLQKSNVTWIWFLFYTRGCWAFVILRTYWAAGSDCSCLQQHFHYASSHCGWILAVCVQVAQKLLNYQVRVLGLAKREEKNGTWVERKIGGKTKTS